MITHELIQGSNDWHQHRRSHWNASDAPAMMGCSPYKTRTQLLHEMHTGLAPEVDAGTQRRFDDGHRFEALARPLAEAIIGDDLYPVTGSDGKLSASFDGLTMCETIGFEHKTLNAELRMCMEGEDETGRLPAQYVIQMEQQCMVSGAGRILFMASKWDGDTLIEARNCWYTPDAELRADIIAGWAQFEIDLANYTPTEVVAEVVGRTPEILPALTITMRGEVSESNLAEFKQVALAAIRSVNRDLKTDQDFADSAKARKWCEDIETRVAAAKDHALGQTKTIDDLFRAMDEISVEARDVRLTLEKLEKARKESRRGEIVAGGIKALADHIAALNARIGKSYMPVTPCDFGGVIKGLRTFDSMQNAVDTALANAKISTSAIADRIQVNLTYLEEDVPQGHAFLFADLSSIVIKDTDDFHAIVDNRISAHKAKREKEEAEQRERIRKEEVERLDREAETREQQRQAEIAFAVLQQRQDPAVAAQHEAMREAISIGMGVTMTAIDGNGTLDVKHVPAANVVPMRTAPAAAPSTPPTLKLGQIGERLGFSLTGDFLKSLGFEPAARDKSALLFHEASFTLICAALVNHINYVQAKAAA